MEKKIYSIKFAFRGVSPMVWRRMKIPGNTSLAILHDIIQIIFNWDDAHLHQFHIYGKDYGKCYSGGLNYVDNVHKVYVEDFGFDIGDKFIYEYNFFEHWTIDIRIENISLSETDITDFTREFKYKVKGNNMLGASKYDEMDIYNRFIDRVRKLYFKDTKENYVDRSKLQEIVDEYFESLSEVKFLPKLMNERLSDELELELD